MSRNKSVDISDIFVKAWFDDYDYMEMLGSGDFGLVVRVREKKTDKQYAMKIIDREWAAEKCASEEAFRIERRILQIVDHIYIVGTSTVHFVSS
jgi:serine/threonine protein kinase